MNERNQQIAIAEFCGYVEGPSRKTYIAPYPEEQDGEMIRQWYAPDVKNYLTPNLPNYLSNRVDMLNALTRLTVAQGKVYAEKLGEVVLDYGCGDFSHNQYMLFSLLICHPIYQAKALLQTLNLWTDETT